MSDKQIDVTLNIGTGNYEFSDGFKMNYKWFNEYVERELDGVPPTDNIEISKAIFGARKLYEETLE